MIRQIAARVCGDTARMFLALGRWLSKADQPVARKRCSWFELPSGTFTPPPDPAAEEMAEWERRHLRINGRPINPNTRGR
jgi:hypothetical protein